MSLGLFWIDQRAHQKPYIARANPLAVERVAPRLIYNAVCILVFVEHLQRHETLPGVRKNDGHRSGIEIEDSGGIERITIQPDDGLVVY